MKPGLYMRSANHLEDAHVRMKEIGVCQEGIDIMASKMRHFIFMARGLDPRAANILKQEMLTVGAEAAMSYHTVSDLTRPTDCLLSGTERQFDIAVKKLATQPFGLSILASDIECAIKNVFCSEPRNFGPLEIGGRTLVMGILNMTPDSFSGDGVSDHKEAIERGIAMQKSGADIIDIGGESTRPDAITPSTEEEMKRVIPIIEALASQLEIPLSIDSRNPEVVSAAIEAGASIVNLVGGLRTKDMAKVISETATPVILMHMQGEPGNMQSDPQYQDVMDDIISELRCQTMLALEAGIEPCNIMVDPGIGFGKTKEHNLEIIHRLEEMKILGMPVLIGTSRKSFIGKVLDAEVGERLEGSLASAVIASLNGADIVRVHDVKETIRALKVADAVQDPYRGYF
ncbi:MAG: dihydropteroate synthase [Thermoplasmata archaeon]|nr:dihydropteroate synthase [Thermoplasmata archaeon]